MAKVRDREHRKSKARRQVSVSIARQIYLFISWVLTVTISGQALDDATRNIPSFPHVLRSHGQWPLLRSPSHVISPMFLNS